MSKNTLHISGSSTNVHLDERDEHWISHLGHL